MENLVISVDSKEDSFLLIQLAKKLGYKIFSISEKEKRVMAKKKLVQIANENNSETISMQEIDDVVSKVRQQRYAKK